MRTITFLFAVLSVLAGFVLSLSPPLGPCTVTPWKVACVFVLLPSVLAASAFLDTGSWEFHSLLFVLGDVQAVAILCVYWWITNRRHRSRHRREDPAA
jgi:hypothetical protein